MLTACVFQERNKIKRIIKSKFVEVSQEKRATRENLETAKAVLETSANEDGEDGSGDSEVR